MKKRFRDGGPKDIVTISNPVQKKVLVFSRSCPQPTLTLSLTLTCTLDLAPTPSIAALPSSFFVPLLHAVQASDTLVKHDSDLNLSTLPTYLPFPHSRTAPLPSAGCTAAAAPA